MGYKRYLVSLANHESKPHPLPATVFLLSSNARLGGASFAFQTSGVASRRGGVTAFCGGAAVKSSGVNFWRGRVSFHFSGVRFRFSGVASRDSGAPIRTSGVRFHFSGASLQTSGVPLKRREFHEFSPIAAVKSAKMLKHACRLGLRQPSAAFDSPAAIQKRQKTGAVQNLSAVRTIYRHLIFLKTNPTIQQSTNSTTLNYG
jgi:hypothetical protein